MLNPSGAKSRANTQLQCWIEDSWAQRAKRSPSASGTVAANRWAAATSRTSTVPMVMSRTAGIFLPNIQYGNSWAVAKLELSVGPITKSERRKEKEEEGKGQRKDIGLYALRAAVNVCSYLQG